MVTDHGDDCANQQCPHAGPYPRPRVLLADDDAEMRKLLAFTLRSEGYDVVECADGAELLEQLNLVCAPNASQRLDLVITDLRMPSVSGLEILRRVGGCRNVPPIILITAFGDEQTHTRARQLGAAASIDKPFDITRFLDLVQALLARFPPSGEAMHDASDPA